MIKTSFSAKAPAKLIISGEHAIVYGAPAIAVAINQHVVTTVGWGKKPTKKSLINPLINFNFKNLRYVKSHTLEKLIILKQQLQDNYVAFLSGHCSIKEVIKKPFELLQYLVTNLIEKLQLQLSDNLEIKVDSDIPIGAGLGSSAACIISCLRSLAYLFKMNWEPKKFLNIAKDIENLQHGKSSGMDLYTSMFGGCNYFSGKSNDYLGNIENLILPNLDFKIVNTGQPLSSTGECVSSVKKHFVSLDLIKEFADITNAFKQALTSNDQIQCIKAMRQNHQLLCQIGVVPDKIRMLIEKIEKSGGAAKICGAGSIYGENAGIVMVIGDFKQIDKIVTNYKFVLQNVNVDYNGVTIV